MKFAKEIEDDLVPEWRAKYFDYKQGKKKIKAIQRAIQNAHRSPRIPIRRTLTPKTPLRELLQSSPNKSQQGATSGAPRPIEGGLVDQTDAGGPFAEGFRRHSTSASSPTQPIPIPTPTHEQLPLSGDYSRDRRVSGSGNVWTRYGSIIGSPEAPVPLSRPATLNLPDPAIDPAVEDGTVSPRTQSPRTESHDSNRPIFGSAPTNSASAFEAGRTRHPSRFKQGLAVRHMSLLNPNKDPTPLRAAERPLLRSIFTSKSRTAQRASKFTDVPLEALQEIESKQNDFFEFLDKQMDRIEDFYREKEEASTHRLKVLKEQLHVMRDQRQAEIEATDRARGERKASKHKKDDSDEEASSSEGNGFRSIPNQIKNMPHSLDVIYHPIKAAKQVHFGKEPKPNLLATPPDRTLNSNKDYTRKPESSDIPYIQAKRKLKVALQEYYRGLELLKSYALLNRTAFRKINKKYDKGVHARPTMRYMTETVNNAWFVRSTVIDEHITATEDLYARYFEKGSHKVAVGKLRRKNRNAGAFTGSVFRNGLMAAAGAVFGIEGLVDAAQIFYSKEGSDLVLATRTSYLLQIYAGYFLLLFLVLFFCLDCLIFTRAKVNYVFVFEFDTRHNLDWRQLSELPCFFLFLMGFFIWINFSVLDHGHTMYTWWPVVLIGFSVLVMFFPAPILYHESRKWFITSCWRLIGAGLYPVEFRDFFLGDMFCSQTYSLGGLELFFCIYAHDWMNPQQCNSSSSRLLGFFTALPGLVRFFQCLRRYKDTRNIFPHLVNAGKYTFTILQYASLSAFRISKTTEMRAFFIACATINGIYCSIWDLVMDWSLMDPYADYPFLRPHLAYKSPYPYYAAMIIDPILRFNWIFYAIPFFSDDIQHSALLGFFVSFSEVVRRGIWTLFRVENEHCTNVTTFRASRDVPLPYKLSSADVDDLLQTPRRKGDRMSKGAAASLVQGAESDDAERDDANALKQSVTRRSDVEAAVDPTPATATGADLERTGTNNTAASSLRRRQQQQGTLPPPTPSGMSIRARVGTILRGAHAQDFERRRKDGEEDGDAASDDDDEDDSDGDPQGSDDEDAEEMQAEVEQRVEGAAGGASQSSAKARSHNGSTGEMSEQARAEAEADQAQDRETNRSNRSDIRDAEMWLQRAKGASP